MSSALCYLSASSNSAPIPSPESLSGISRLTPTVDQAGPGEVAPAAGQGLEAAGALDGTSYLIRHSFQQIGKRQPTVKNLSHPAWQWDEQAVQSTNQRMEGLAINTLLVQLYQPELLTTGPAAKVPSGKGFSAGAADAAGAVSPQGPVWIGKDFRLDGTPRAPFEGTAAGSSSASRRPHWRRGHWHTVLHGEKRQSRRM